MAATIIGDANSLHARACPRAFAGCRRCEFGTARYGGHRYPTVLHLPRGMRDRLLKALQRRLDEPLDGERSPRSFRRSAWQARGVRSGWHLRHVYALDGMLDYIAKVPKDKSGEAVPRAVRVKTDARYGHEYETFGLSGPERAP